MKTITGLDPGQKYNVTVYTVSNGVKSEGTSEMFTTSLDAATPALVNISSRELTISWRDPQNTSVSHYTVYTTTKDGTNGNEYNVSSSPSETYTHTFTNLVPGETYTSTVIVYSTGQQTNTANRTDTTHPLAVLTFSANTTTTDSVYLSWAASSESKQDGFKITYNGGVEIYESATSGQTSYNKSISNLTPGFTYIFTISPYSFDSENTKIFSQTSKEAKETTVPLSPTDVKLTTSTTAPSTTLEASWTVPNDNDNGVKYKTRLDKVTTPTNNGTIKEANQTINSDIFNGLVAGAGYKVFVWAEAGDLSETGKRSTMSNSTVVYTQPTKPIQPVRDLSKTTTNTLSINWTMPSSSGEYDGFIAFVPAENIQVSTNKDNMTAIFNGLTAGTAYNVSVVSVVGNNVQSNNSTRDNLYTKPNKPDSVQVAKQTNSSIEINWTRPPGGVARYKTILNQGNPEDNSLNTTKTFSNLNVGTLYTVTVYCETVDGTQSGKVTKQYYTAPALPTNLQENTTARTTTTVGVTWTAPAAGRYDGYSITISGRDKNQTSTLTNDTLHHVFDNVTPGSVYTVKLKATLSNLFSTEVMQQVTAIPEKPVNLRENTQNKARTSIDILWYAPVNGLHPEYYIEWLKGGSSVGNDTVTETTKIITGLESGQKYNVTVYTVNNGVKSDGISELFTTSVDAATPGLVSISSGELTISWGDPENINVSHYIVYTTTKDGIKGNEYHVERLSLKRYTYTFTGLMPGETYNTTVVIYSEGEIIKTASRIDTTYPLPVLTFSAETSRTDSIDLSWTVSSASKQDGFKIISSFGEEKFEMASADVTNYKKTIYSLTPGATYTFLISTYSLNNANISIFSQTSKETMETTVPLPPNVECGLIRNTSFGLIITQPRLGLVKQYHVACEACNHIMTIDKDNNSNQTRLTINSRNQLTSYDYKVWSVQMSTNGRMKISSAVTGVCMAINGPPAIHPVYDKEPIITLIGKKTTIQWDKVTLNFTNPFIDRTGQILRYSVIVANAVTPDEELKEAIDKTWSMAYEQKSSPPYAAIYKCKELFEDLDKCNGVYLLQHARRKRSVLGKTVKIVIGADTTCDSTSIADDVYCNGPLKPETKYRIFIRAYNENNEFTNAKSVIIETGRRPLPITTIIVSVVMVFFVVLVLCIILLLWRYGKLGCFKSYLSNNIQACHPIKIAEFTEHCQKLYNGFCTKCISEYENIRRIKLPQSAKVGNLECNRLKNRFIDIIPPDFKRVRLLSLRDQKGSDYINASWMPGYNSTCEFIVSQAPLDTTVDDH